MSAQLLFDRLSYVDRLKAAGIGEAQARAHADGLEQAFREEVATKSDIAALSAKMDARFAQADAKVDTKFAEIDARFDRMDAKFEAKFDRMDAKFDQMDAKFEAKFLHVEAKFDAKFAILQTDIQKSQNRILLALITISFALLGAIKYLH
jgi:hypothetical protein